LEFLDKVLFKLAPQSLKHRVRSVNSISEKSVKKAVGINFTSKASSSGLSSTMFIPVGCDTVCAIAMLHDNYKEQYMWYE
jgi:hypothetical protein